VQSTASSDGTAAATDEVGDAAGDDVATPAVAVGAGGAGTADGAGLGDGAAPHPSSSTAAIVAIERSTGADLIRIIDA